MSQIISLPERAAATSKVVVGSVALVGAGPGDPDLITVKAMKLIQQADTVVYDRLVNPELLALAATGCEKIYVGKRKHQHCMPQDQICQLLVELAQQGKKVVRLKGGDPFVFGRGGEELDVLRANDIPWQVVPGITAATGCAASSGIPLTHRDCAHGLTFLTAQRKNGELNFNWNLALAEGQTVVFYMGLSLIEDIASGLVSRGRGAATPMAVISNGTCGDEKVVTGTLGDIAAKVEAADLPSPALILMGDVVGRSIDQVRAAAQGQLEAFSQSA